VTQLRKMMLEELQRRNYSQTTVNTYLKVLADFARYFHRPPDELGKEQIRAYQVHLFQEGQAEVYVVSGAGGKPRNLTSFSANGGFPTFSSDGRWVYFTSQRAGGHHIWKAPVSGGEAIQVTNNDGEVALESPDGAYIYYMQTIDRPSALWRFKVSGGSAVKVLDGVVSGNFVVLNRGIYYMEQPSVRHAFSILTSRSASR
jgi:Tol biopolymer transport system component